MHNHVFLLEEVSPTGSANFKNFGFLQKDISFLVSESDDSPLSAASKMGTCDSIVRER